MRCDPQVRLALRQMINKRPISSFILAPDQACTSVLSHSRTYPRVVRMKVEQNLFAAIRSQVCHQLFRNFFRSAISKWIHYRECTSRWHFRSSVLVEHYAATPSGPYQSGSDEGHENDGHNQERCEKRAPHRGTLYLGLSSEVAPHFRPVLAKGGHDQLLRSRIAASTRGFLRPCRIAITASGLSSGA